MTDFHTKLREAMLKACCCPYEGCHAERVQNGGPCIALLHNDDDPYEAEATYAAVLRAIAAAGGQIVPVEPITLVDEILTLGHELVEGINEAYNYKCTCGQGERNEANCQHCEYSMEAVRQFEADVRVMLAAAKEDADALPEEKP